MVGALQYRPLITRKMLKDEPGTLFVFGDNFVEKGLGGLAKETRGESNAVGIPTKRYPSMEEGSFFTDEDFARFKEISDPRFVRLAYHIRNGGVVVWPASGIGTGLADLENRSPRIWNYIKRCEEKLASL